MDEEVKETPPTPLRDLSDDELMVRFVEIVAAHHGNNPSFSDLVAEFQKRLGKKKR